MKKIKSSVSLFLILVMLASVFCACNKGEDEVFRNMEDFAHTKIGILTGTPFDIWAQEYYPEAERVYYNNVSDWALSLRQGKVDCALMDKAFFTPLDWEDDILSYMEMEMMPATKYGVGFSDTAKGEALKTQFNEFLAARRESGWLSAEQKKWFGSSEPDDAVLDFSKLSGENGTLRVGTAAESKPFNYLKNGAFYGFDAVLMYTFAEEYGYAVEVDVITFGGLLPGLAIERYDVVASSLMMTEERKEAVIFSEPYMVSPVVMGVLAEKLASPKTMTMEELKTATLGIVTGTNWDVIAQRDFPNAERKYFTTSADALLAVQQGKVDAFFADKTVYAGMRWENRGITCIDEPLVTSQNAFVLPKEGYNTVLLGQLNAFIAKSKGDATLTLLAEKWFGNEEPAAHPDYAALTGENGTITVAVGDSMKPLSYKKGTAFTGYEVEFLTLFAKEYGYRLEITGMAFEALLSTVSSGRCDIGACGVAVMPERAESVTFTDPHFETYGVAVVRGSVIKENKKTLADFENAVIGVHTGTIYDDYAKTRFPNAKRQYFNLLSDMILAVEQGKIDGYLSETTYVAAALWENAKIDTVDAVIDRSNAGYIFSKGVNTAVREKLNAFIAEAKRSGLLAELQEKWLGDTEPQSLFDPSSLTGENGTLKVAVSPDLKPLSYMRDGNVVGYEVEVLQRFAKEYGYQLEFTTMTFDGILPGVISGKYDIGSGGISITAERAESVDFSESHLSVDVVMAIKAEEPVGEEKGFWSEVKESFSKTFIREERWKLILEGIGVTMLISLSSAIAGTALGFGLYMLSRSDVKQISAPAKAIAKGYSRIVAGTPVVVVLMILFYVVFGHFKDMSGIAVAIIGFTLTFGAFVYDHMSVSVGSVDRGQTEAAFALGYTKNRTFFRIIFPQAMDVFLPSYCGQAVELIKATAVVGYIAVNDLTKMGDIIRSNTYEAFFPLIATAVIYFFLTWLLAFALGFLKRYFEPKRRKKEDILKGVKTV